MITLRDKFRGCIAASWAGSAMGAPVEGWLPERIKEMRGFVDTLLPYKHYTSYTDWDRPPGTTEDGIERQKLIATAIIEKQDRILAHDLVAVWVRDLDPARIIYKQERFDRSLLELARGGVPPSEMGRLWPYPNVVSMARASHPVGLINAGDPQGAADDSFEVGQVYMKETSFGLRWAALYNASIAEACKPDATVESLRGGWMHTGDLGRLDEEGFLYIVDRKKDMIITGAENVYPREVEEVLYTHPKIAEAAVIGVADTKWGEAVKAVVSLKQGATTSGEEIIDFCRARIARFKCPKSVDFVSALPKNAAGKILKRELRERYGKSIAY